MISFDTFFTTIISLSVFYVTVFVTLKIAKKNKPSLHIKCYIITLTVICVLFASIASILCFGHMPFGTEILAVAQSILRAFEETSFAFNNFYIIYFCGIVGFLPIGILCCYWAVSEFIEIVTIVVDIALNILAVLIIPYFTGTFIYVHLSTISFLLTALASLFANLLMSYILATTCFILEKVDEII